MQTTKLPEFTLRESDILHLLARSCSRKQLAERLHVSYSTINAHLYSIFKKTEVHGIAELISYAQDRGFGIQSPRITEALSPLPVNQQNSETS